LDNIALIVDAQVKVGVIGCPNLPLNLANPENQGHIFVAVRLGRGHGAEQVNSF
jgi:3'(2'), 5'-bisphosphate nucleotidase